MSLKIKKNHQIPILSSAEASENRRKYFYPAQQNFLAMYSSLYEGIVSDPFLMNVPIDDHLVHRGDGVFEAIKVVHRRPYLIEAHIQRLFNSAQSLDFNVPYSKKFVTDVVYSLIESQPVQQALVRLFLSRGPGSFSVNPYDTVGTQLYAIITTFQPIKSELYLNGVKVGRSSIPPKQGTFAQVKSCNYLNNVMMKKESVDRGFDFTVGFNSNGFLTESATENMILISSEGTLMHPFLEGILKGTTMGRLFDLVDEQIDFLSQQSSSYTQLINQKKVNKGKWKVQEVKPIINLKRGANITESDILSAREVMLVGTTLDVVPVSSFEKRNLSMGPWAQIFLEMIHEDQAQFE